MHVGGFGCGNGKGRRSFNSTEKNCNAKSQVMFDVSCLFFKVVIEASDVPVVKFGH